MLDDALSELDPLAASAIAPGISRTSKGLLTATDDKFLEGVSSGCPCESGRVAPVQLHANRAQHLFDASSNNRIVAVFPKVFPADG
jgi:hypothetical protein